MFSWTPRIGGSSECNDVTWPQMKANSLQGVINLFLKEANSIIYRKEPDVETHCNGRQDEEISKKLCPYHNATQLQSAFAISSFTLFNWSCLWILSKRLIFCLLTRYSCIGQVFIRKQQVSSLRNHLTTIGINKIAFYHKCCDLIGACYLFCDSLWVASHCLAAGKWKALDWKINTSTDYLLSITTCNNWLGLYP